ncbi:MAG: NAD+ synthase [Bdellovibrionales bacterium]
MSKPLVVAIAQLNPIVGDLAGNTAKVMAAWKEAGRRGADLVITPEMVLTGYCPDDFILKPRVHKILRECVDSLARDMAAGPALLLGTPWLEDKKLYNAALLIEGGKIIGKTFKRDLPNYGPFDEKRYFESGPAPEPVLWRGRKLGILLCEDMWSPQTALELRRQDAKILLVPNGSPFQIGKQQKRYALAAERAKETGLSLVYVNQYGGQDELVYEGASFVVNGEGALEAQARYWSEDLLLVPFNESPEGLLKPESTPFSPRPSSDEETYQALMTGLRDYLIKNDFSSVVIGLSGGIDSALVATLAVDVLGPSKVQTVMMPSRYTLESSIEDAHAIAKHLSCRLDILPIDELMGSFDTALSEMFIGCEPDVTEENLQARIRGTLLMAISNKNGAMLLSTGNKSELSVGYATLYGDMCGGYAPLKDVYKTDVYKLARWRNEHHPFLSMGPTGASIPERVLTKPPSAELKENQTDQDTLPPYDILDGILKCLIEQDLGVAETTMMGYQADTICKIYTMLDRAEYKRRQAPPGPKITRKHLTKDRRYPITNRYSDKWLRNLTD